MNLLRLLTRPLSLALPALLTALAAVTALVGSQLLADPAGAADAQPRPVSPRGALLPDEAAVVRLFEETAPSVAYITTESVQRNALGGAEVSQGAGSGFVWDSAGHVVTNFHVVDGARRVYVQLDAGKPIEAETIGIAPEYDLAVIRLKSLPRALRPVPLGSSRDLRIGQTVYAIGNPFGLQRTLTKGLVSALDRELPTANFREVVGVIQTDAAINPGNSGGPLLDSAGRLIGVNSAIRSASGSSSGIGFAIPADLVNRVVPALISKGHAPLPGIGVTPVRPDLVARAGITGVVLAEVGRGTPAAQAGLVAMNRRTGDLGDVITAVNGRSIESLSDFVVELERAGVDTQVELTVKRGERERRVRVRVIDLRE
ncbi:S1C family serine protease [Leptothrix sp. BB-4]